MGKGRSPSRRRYEAEHPTLTARVSAELKASLDAALAAEGTTFSEWVRRQASGAAQARRDESAIRRTGYAAGLTDGRAQGRAVYLIIGAAMLWREYGDRLGGTDDAWVDRHALECARGMSPGAHAYLLDRLERAPKLRAAVDRWLSDSELPALSD